MKLTNETELTPNDMVEAIVQNAITDFCTCVAASYPEIKTGDLEPLKVFNFFLQARHVVYSWLEENSEEKLNSIPTTLIECMRREEVAFNLNKANDKLYWDEETWRALNNRIHELDKEEHTFLFAWDSEFYWPGTTEIHNYRWMSSNEDLLLGDKGLIADLRVGQSTSLRKGFTVTRLS